MNDELTPEQSQRREDGIKALRSRHVDVRPDYKFDRDEANSRDGLRRWLDGKGKPLKDSE